MRRLRRIVLEVHRRSIWQVLAVYLAGSWVALQVVDALTRTAGLPDWVPPFAIVLLVVGLPIVLATAVVQEGGVAPSPSPASGPETTSEGPSREPTSTPAPSPGTDREVGSARAFLQRHLTWKRAILAGVAAFALLGFAVTGYFAMRIAGVGPVASLVAQGVLDERERILLADFRNATNDPLLGSVVTEALRIDLASSPALSLVEAAQIQDALRRMERDPASALTPELGREMAVRDGIKAVLEGEVGAAGSGFILSATLRAAEDGATLATFRRTAHGPDAVIDAIDKLSQDIRERVGESLRSIRRGGPLRDVTTSSLEALRKYTEAEQLIGRGDEMGGLALLGEAVVLDTAFAMAYRKEAVVLRNLGIRRGREIEALERAYRHRTRLTEKERYLAEAAYHSGVTGDQDAVIRAYENALRLDPDDPAALNNLANEYQAADDLDRAEELYRRNIAGPWPSNVPHQNLVRNQLRQGSLEGAREALAAYAKAYPDDFQVREMAFWVHAFSGEPDAAARETETVIHAPGVAAPRRVTALMNRAVLAVSHGRMQEARAGFEEAAAAAAEVSPALEQLPWLAEAWTDVWVAGDTLRARARLGELERSGLMERVPVEARDYSLIVSVYLLVGDAGRALEWLGRWREEVSPEYVSRGSRSDQEFLESWAREGRDDPEIWLQALEARRREARCPLCAEEARPLFLSLAGHTEEAREAWTQLVDRTLGNSAVSLALIPVALEEIGRLSEELGDQEAAADAYRRFIERWAGADPELQPRVDRARERLAVLEGAL